jgi:hypothetical protein
LARRVAAETADFMLGSLQAGGMFTSSLDADAAGSEGSTYVWTPAQLRNVLGDDEPWAATVFGVTDAGTFEHGSSVLQLSRDPDDPVRFARVKAALLAARRERVQPGRDDKVVTAWNGLAITALAEAGIALQRPDLVDAARGCADALLISHLVNDRLRRASLGGLVGDSPAILEDYGALATGLLTLHQITGEASWLMAATDILDTALAQYADGENPGRWFDTAADAERLVLRPADPIDGATPSGASLITEALMIAGHLAPEGQRYRQAAERTLAAHTLLIARASRSAGHWLAIAEATVRGPLQIAVACEDAGSQLLGAARLLAPGGAMVVGGPADSSELLAGRGRVDGADAAYICRGPVCDVPVTTTQALAAALAV